MWISKRKFQELEKRIADLEMAVRSQQKEITSLNYPYEDVKQHPDCTGTVCLREGCV